MDPVTVSKDFTIQIPEDVRTSMKLAPGTQVQVFQIGTRIEVVPVREARELRGAYPGVNGAIEEDEAPE